MKPLNALLEMALRVANAICDETIERRESPIQQRVSISILQARALECRTFAGLLLINGHRLTHRFPQGPVREAVAQVVAMLSVQQRERSKRLEDMGKKLATQPWPPTGEEFPPEEESRIEVVH